ncbi:hypothetical protein K7X08_004679 [Anisodus acutangulus]|uniref:Uncharacterized protein n=1 Tax=Anisodus acutangulus TaxID=402998 RepID=A0A9Q1MH92_9SOLA|nr:hypothetical protein K7X08_004679 [Anisodus acutangulus]
MPCIVESTFEEEKSEERSNAKAHVEGSKNAVQPKLVATPNIEEEFAPEEFCKFFQGIFDIFKSDACFHGIRPHNKIELRWTIPFYSCGDIWFDTGQDFRADSDVFLSTESEELKRYEGLTSLITHTMLAGEDAMILECFPYLFEQPSLPLVLVNFRDLTMTKKLKNGLHTWHVSVSKPFVGQNREVFDTITRAKKLKCSMKVRGLLMTLKQWLSKHNAYNATYQKFVLLFARLRDMYAHIHEKWTTHVELVMLASLVISDFANEAVICKDNIDSTSVGGQCGARMYVIQERPIISRVAGVIVSANVATEVALRLVRPGSETTYIPKPTQKVVKVYDYKIIESVLRYQLKQFVIAANKVILSVFNPAIVVDKNIKQEALASGVVNNLMEALIFSALKALRVVIFLIKEYPTSLSRALGHAANLDLSKESTSIVGAVFYLDSNSGTVTRIGRNTLLP